MKNWIKALLSETVSSIWWILSALSTLSTFFLQGLPNRWRTASAISAILGFTWANFQVFRKHERQISALTAELATLRARASRLRIGVDHGSRYILAPVNSVPHGAFNGMFVEFHLMIENTGLRDSTVDTYSVEIVELSQKFGNLRPEEGRNGIQGRRCQFGWNRATELSNTGIVRIDAENSTNHGSLLFFLKGVSLEQFTGAGLQMQGEQRQFGTLHVRLTVTDTTQSSATADFQMDEA